MIRNKRMLLPAVPLVVGVAGLTLVAVAAATPWHTDSPAYFEHLNAIRNDLYDAEQPDVRTASRRFFALQDAYGTHKWLYADIGYSLLAWSALTLVPALVGSRIGLAWLGRAIRRVWVLAGLSCLSMVLITGGFIAGPLHQLSRELVPEWADSVGVILFETVYMVAVLSPIILLSILAPLPFRRVPGAPLFVLTKRPHWVAAMATLLYAVPMLLAGLLVLTFGQPGGWALSVAGVLLLWLFLNARALWIGPSSR